MNIPALAQKVVGNAMSIAQSALVDVTFYYSSSFDLNPVSDSVATISATKTVKALVYRENVTAPQMPGGMPVDVTEDRLLVTAWHDAPPPNPTSTVVVAGVMRSIKSVEPDPTNSVWVIAVASPDDFKPSNA